MLKEHTLRHPLVGQRYASDAARDHHVRAEPWGSSDVVTSRCRCRRSIWTGRWSTHVGLLRRHEATALVPPDETACRGWSIVTLHLTLLMGIITTETGAFFALAMASLCWRRLVRPPLLGAGVSADDCGQVGLFLHGLDAFVLSNRPDCVLDRLSGDRSLRTSHSL